MNKFLGNRAAVAVFILPALLLYSVIVFWPLLQTLYRSLFQWDGLNPGTFLFLDNYKELFQDELFRTSVYNGLIFAVIIAVFQIGVGTLLAFGVADAYVKGRKWLRISFFIPVVLSVTVVCQLWMAVYNGEYGLLNRLFQAFGMSYRQDWLSDPDKAIYAIAMVNAWHFMGYHFALLFAAVKSIPEHFLEAARIDGASKWKAHWLITVPLLRETYRFCLVLAVTGGLSAFAQMFIMTGGGPGTSTYTLTYLMYRSAFRINEFGYGSASAVVLVIECLIVTLLINRLVARDRIVY
ncbi:ABC transporter permease subunit [Cohnella sp. CFH 77786]|uniref:carbohydrate ABC transporter permease n=1 Tax=Cohnella sp. CFH 77786 TaxID=2662265 RepID=UPI001C610BF2|nr:sugar ABC transporter permease [Cohnella sp. CFH 77786]MBW5449283.1 ABC transporter permease subunit [Cohnella sp. CFH 77786]